MSQFKVTDNFLEKKSFTELKNIIFSNKIPWYLQEKTTDKFFDINWLSHVLFLDGEVRSELFEPVMALFKNIDVHMLSQVRLNLVMSVPKSLRTEWHKDPLTDKYAINKTAIFYFNDGESGTMLNLNKEIKFIQNKENRFLEFDQNTLHCGFLEKNLLNRIVINFNYSLASPQD